jgi:superoxide reductase
MEGRYNNMTALKQVYRCEVCGNIVEVLHAGAGELFCCGKPMVRLTENTVDASREKHVPVIEKVDGGYKVSVGSAPHPMEDKHYIEWIELSEGDAVLRKFLKPGDKPEAFFEAAFENPTAREYCNLHGLWRK